MVPDERICHPILELALSNQPEHLSRRACPRPPTQGAFIAHRVSPIELGLHAHADYLAHHGTSTSVKELAQHSSIGYDQETSFTRRMGSKLPGLGRGLRTGRLPAAVFDALEVGLAACMRQAWI